MSRVVTEDISSEDMKLVKKVRKEKEPKDLRSVFNKHVEAIYKAGIASIKFPWMNKKAFRLITDANELREWAKSVLEGPRYPVPRTDEIIPAVAVDTETTGLDNRVIMLKDGRYKIKNEIAGICLSSNGYDGIYIPVTHEDGNNIDRDQCRQILQELFDQCQLIFYNAKYDKEVLALLMGITIRGYPYIEDVQVDAYLDDPKADMGDKGFEADGLKYQSKTRLDMDQIELKTLTKVKAEMYNPTTGKVTIRSQHAPFNWVPTEIALWYAAGDAICTWLLWDLLRDSARAMKLAHKIDHELIDTITWMERQRFHVDVEKLNKTIKWHQSKLDILKQELAEIADWDGEDEFNPSSPLQLVKILFDKRGFKPIRVSEKTKVPSTDADTLDELKKLHPDDPFLKKLIEYREYAALHPGNLQYDPTDHSARIYLRQCVVAGGRLSATGGDFEKDGGFGLNIQAIKRIEGNNWIQGRRILSAPEEEYTEEDLHPSCFKDKEGKRTKAKGIVNNHYGEYFGDLFCLVPSCKCCDFIKGPDTLFEKVDSEEILNIRGLFIALFGYTFFTTDYSNIEMRVAANISKEENFIKEFLEGEGDFHSLTARAVFPEFSDPKTPKDRKKFLRSLAKILNFALLYGGTAYTILESMSKVQKDITFKECEEMVNKYWEGVPGFAAWVAQKQKVAKEQMICKTATGRIVKFESAMQAQHIYYPTEEHKKNYRRWWEIKNSLKELEEAKKAGEDVSESAIYKLKMAADNMYFDKATGVRNMQDYRKFLGKIQRVSMNIPLQGFAGDLMRMSLNRIRIWSQSDPGVENVYELHGTVHDEIDYSVKNEYVPFIIPRLTRLMKLRDLHVKMNWPVPIECDTEYGRSWDVTEHLTGDDGHEPAGWSMIPGLENYIPGGVNNFDKVLKALETNRDKALEYLKENLHPRTKVAQEVLKKYLEKHADISVIRTKLIVCYQLDEYWNIDQEEDDDRLETLSEYETRMGLDPKNRPDLPAGGRLGTFDSPVVLQKIEPEDTLEEEEEADVELEEEEQQGEQQGEQQESQGPVEYEYHKDGWPILRDDLDEKDFDELIQCLGIGNQKVVFGYMGRKSVIDKVFKTEIPDKYKKVK